MLFIIEEAKETFGLFTRNGKSFEFNFLSI